MGQLAAVTADNLFEVKSTVQAVALAGHFVHLNGTSVVPVPVYFLRTPVSVHAVIQVPVPANISSSVLYSK